MKELLLYLKNVKRYQSIFVEDNLLGKELVDENFDGEAKPDLLIVFFRKNVPASLNNDSLSKRLKLGRLELPWVPAEKHHFLLLLAPLLDL